MDANERMRFLKSESDAILRFARLDLGAPIEACPGWTMPDLLKHVGGGQRWIEAAIRQRATEHVEVDWGVPGDDDDVLEWFERGAAALLRTARSVDVEAPMHMLWNAGGGSIEADFLRRRATNEAAIHRWDAERAVDEPSPIPIALALDCVDELVSRWLPWAASVGRQAQGSWSGETVVLRAGGRSWTVTFVGAGNVRAEAADRGGDATVIVEASPSAMALFTMNRGAARELGLQVHGDAHVLSRWRTEVRFGSRGAVPSNGE